MKMKKIAPALLRALIYSAVFILTVSLTVTDTRPRQIYADAALLPDVAVSGKTYGIRMYSDGLVVVALGDITQTDGLRRSGAREAGISVGDVITRIDGEEVTSSAMLNARLQKSEGDVVISYIHDGEEKTAVITPSVAITDGCKRLGMWVRDATAGLGTVTFFDPETMRYGALGHPISDVDTGVRFRVQSGSLTDCAVSGIVRAENGRAGALRGDFTEDDAPIGSIELNCEYGIFGRLYDGEGEIFPCASHDKVETGAAVMLSNIRGDEVEAFDVEIIRIYYPREGSSRDMIIRVSDPRLLDATGGIVQGMSGSPIIQNGALIGALTHVFVDSPDCGYAVFIEKMLEKSDELTSDFFRQKKW